jgi:hypothetical protein
MVDGVDVRTERSEVETFFSAATPIQSISTIPNPQQNSNSNNAKKKDASSASILSVSLESVDLAVEAYNRLSGTILKSAAFGEQFVILEFAR